MKHHLEPRADGISIPGLTDEILKRLEPPYDLIAEWTRYVPLMVLLRVNFTLFYVFRDNDDGTATMLWAQVSSIGDDYIVPLNLLRRSLATMDPIHDLKPAIPWRDEMFFMIEDGRVVTQASFCAAIIG